MSGDLLTGLAGVLGSTAAAAHPDALAEALVTHLDEPLRVRSAALLGKVDNALVVLGMSGYRVNEVDGLSAIPLDRDYPALRAFHDGEVVIDAIAELEATYEGFSAPTARWRHIRDRVPSGTSVSAPMIIDGRSVGAFTLICADKEEWSTLELGALSAIGSALGLWITHPDSGVPTDRRDRPLPALSERQVAILRGVADGLSNARIADTLGVSASTVKQDLGQAFDRLGVTTRSEAVERARLAGLLVGTTP